MAFSLFMMDSATNNINKMDQKKRINISKIDKILKVNPVPLSALFTVFYFELIFVTAARRNYIEE